jgi:hypothetical protein
MRGSAPSAPACAWQAAARGVFDVPGDLIGIVDFAGIDEHEAKLPRVGEIEADLDCPQT